MKTAILVGGLGTRLRPVVGTRPKPLAPVAGKPFLVHLVERLRQRGFVEIVLCAGYRWRDIEETLGDGSALAVSLAYSVEATPLGTAGALRHARHLLPETFLALNGDSVVDVDLERLVAFHREKRAAATLTLARVGDTGPYGAVEIDPAHAVTAFHEKVAAKAGGGRVNAGVYVMEPAVLDLIPDGRAVSLERETLALLLQRGGRVVGFPVESGLLDIGTPEGYQRSQAELWKVGSSD